MLEPNVQKLLAELKSSDVVLDVGGWACRFNRANWILDCEPYNTRGAYRAIGGPISQGGDTECFSEDTWLQRDICSREAFPFRDKSIDFAICSHTLEDIRDPLWVCSELIRVAKRGYIEVPSREWETCRGLERPNEVGLSHHRWLIDVSGKRLRFLMKFHLIHSHWRFSLPRSHAIRQTPEQQVQWLWWEDSFDFEEVIIHGVGNLERELERFVEQTRPYPAGRLALDRQARRAGSLLRRAIAKMHRIVRRW